MSNRASSYSFFAVEGTAGIGPFNNIYNAGTGWPLAQIIVEPLDRFRQVNVVYASGVVNALELVFYSGTSFDGRAATTLPERLVGEGEVLRVPFYQSTAPGGALAQYSMIGRQSNNPGNLAGVNPFVTTCPTVFQTGFAGQPHCGKQLDVCISARMIELRIFPPSAANMSLVCFLGCVSSRYPSAMYHRQDFSPTRF